MDFTREPVIETVITPREGSKLVVRSSKGVSHEEYFVDAVEMVSFGGASFFRSLEKPKSFIVPVSDYEVLEVRETRMVLKHATSERAIKISSNRKNSKKEEQEEPEEKKRKRTRRRRRNEPKEQEDSVEPDDKVDLPKPRRKGKRRRTTSADEVYDDAGEAPKELPNLLPPPPKLISETISRYREKFKTAFYGEDEIEKIADEGRATPHIPPADEKTGKWDFTEALKEASEEQPLQ